MLLNLLRCKSFLYLKQAYSNLITFKKPSQRFYGRFYSTISEIENQSDLTNNIESKSEDKNTSEGPWIGGKTPGGLLVTQENFIKVMLYGKRITKINISHHGSTTKAKEYAQKMLYDYCSIKKLLVNEYRYKNDEKDNHLEVKAGEITFICDPEDLDLIESFSWMHSKKAKLIYSHEKNMSFIEHKIGLDPDRFDISFMNENIYDYRKRNISVLLKDKTKKIKRVGKLRIIDDYEEKPKFESLENREIEEEKI